MSRGVSDKITYKPYNQSEQWLLPPSLDEPATIKLMDSFALNNGWQLDFSTTRLHHEIYLSDPRKTSPEKLRTIIRHPVRKSK